MNEDTVLYDNIGKGYNLTRRADPYLVEKLYQLLSPVSIGLYADIGCGTGNYTTALADKGLKFYGVEPSEEMRSAARLHKSGVTWLNGHAENMPVASAFFDGAIATLTIHHWLDLAKAFREINRVLKEGSNLVIFTADPDQMRGYWLNHYFPQMLEKSIRQMPPAEVIFKHLKEEGFGLGPVEKYFIAPDLQDNFLYAGKNHPERYFDANIRNGISSFAALANRDEVNAGLKTLRADIDTGNFKQIQARYENEKGDYLFIKATKPTT